MIMKENKSDCEGKMLKRNFNISRNDEKDTRFWRPPNKNHWQISLHIFAFENIPSTFYFFPPEKNTFY